MKTFSAEEGVLSDCAFPVASGDKYLASDGDSRKFSLHLSFPPSVRPSVCLSLWPAVPSIHSNSESRGQFKVKSIGHVNLSRRSHGADLVGYRIT